MTEKIAYTRTAKGNTEIAAAAGVLTRGLKMLLGMVTDKTLHADISIRLPQVPGDKLKAALARLERDGYIALVVEQEDAPQELDFTRFISRPVKEPTLTQRKQAEATLAGARRTRPGYHVSILNRPEQRIAPRSGAKHCILIIDADESTALAVARNLLVAGFDVRSAAAREEILAELNRQPMPDAIVMDVDLPDTIGLELLGKLRQHPKLSSVPIVVATAKVQHDDVVAALAYGASGYLTKPLKPEAMVDSIKGVLGL
jgi:CheY-like chemotaxis protein